jgi:hypothetical protein
MKRLTVIDEAFDQQCMYLESILWLELSDDNIAAG